MSCYSPVAELCVQVFRVLDSVSGLRMPQEQEAVVSFVMSHLTAKAY